MEKEKKSGTPEEKQTDLHFATKWFSDMAQTFNETYKKQVDMSFDMFNNFFNASYLKKQPLDEDAWGLNIFRNSADMFKKNLQTYTDISKKLIRSGERTDGTSKESKGFSENISGAIDEMYNKQISQYRVFNKEFLDLLQQHFKGTTLDSSLYSNAFKKEMDELFDSSIESIKYLLRSYEETSDFSIAENKKLIDEISNQIDLATKTNLDFWSGAFKSIKSNADFHAPRRAPGASGETARSSETASNSESPTEVSKRGNPTSFPKRAAKQNKRATVKSK